MPVIVLNGFSNHYFPYIFLLCIPHLQVLPLLHIKTRTCRGQRERHQRQYGYQPVMWTLLSWIYLFIEVSTNDYKDTNRHPLLKRIYKYCIVFFHWVSKNTFPPKHVFSSLLLMIYNMQGAKSNQVWNFNTFLSTKYQKFFMTSWLDRTDLLFDLVENISRKGILVPGPGFQITRTQNIKSNTNKA